MLLRETEATVAHIHNPTEDQPSLQSQIQSRASQDRIKASGMDGRRFSGVFAGQYEWEIETTGSSSKLSEQKVIRERVEVSDALSLAWAVSIVTATLFWTFFWNPFAALGAVLGAVMFYGALPYLYPTQIFDLEDCTYEESYTGSVVPRILLGLGGITWLIPSLTHGIPISVTETTVANIPVVLVLAGAALLFSAVGIIAIAGEIPVRRLGLVDRLKWVPIHAATLTGGYALFFAITALPLFIFNSNMYDEIQVSLYPLGNRLPFLTSIIVVICAAVYFVSWHLGPNRRYITNQGLAELQSDRQAVQEQGRWSKRNFRRLTSLIITVGVSVAVFSTLNIYWTQFGHRVFLPILNWNFYPIFDEPELSILSIAILLPVTYFFAGLLYQVTANLWQTAKLVYNSEYAHTFGTDPSYEVRRLPDSYTSGPIAVSVGWYKFIGVPRRFLDNRNSELLPEDEYTALLEHERSHLVNGDATLAFVVTLLSPLIFVGSNVILALLDYRAREIRADADVTDKNDLRSVLDKYRSGALDNLEESESNPDTTASSPSQSPTQTTGVPGVVPTTPGVSSSSMGESRLMRIFQPYFGSFAMTQAHPSYQERLNIMLMSQQESNPA